MVWKIICGFVALSIISGVIFLVLAVVLSIYKAGKHN